LKDMNGTFVTIKSGCWRFAIRREGEGEGERERERRKRKDRRV